MNSSLPKIIPIKEVEPKDKSDAQWLHDEGYADMSDFMRKYRCKTIEEANRNLNDFRNEQQGTWENIFPRFYNRGKYPLPSPLAPSETDPFKVSIEDSLKECRLKKKKARRIEAFMSWHRSRDHISYDVFRWALNISDEVRESVDELDIEDVTHCQP